MAFSWTLESWAFHEERQMPHEWVFRTEQDPHVRLRIDRTDEYAEEYDYSAVLMLKDFPPHKLAISANQSNFDPLAQTFTKAVRQIEHQFRHQSAECEIPVLTQGFIQWRVLRPCMTDLWNLPSDRPGHHALSASDGRNIEISFKRKIYIQSIYRGTAECLVRYDHDWNGKQADPQITVGCSLMDQDRRPVGWWSSRQTHHVGVNSPDTGGLWRWFPNDDEDQTQWPRFHIIRPGSKESSLEQMIEASWSRAIAALVTPIEQLLLESGEEAF